MIINLYLSFNISRLIILLTTIKFRILVRLGHIIELLILIIVVALSHKYHVRILTINLLIVLTSTLIIFLTVTMFVFSASSVYNRHVRLLLFFHYYRIAHYFASCRLQFFSRRVYRLSNRKIDSLLRLFLWLFKSKDLKELRF